MTDFPNLLEKIVAGKNLSEEEAKSVAKEILSGTLPQNQIAGFLTAMRGKGEAIDEIVGFVKAMREAMTQVNSSHSLIVDTCGTGGDRKGTFNISTAAAFVVAGAGYAVAKHGNRSVSSSCGSADVLQALGVKIDMSQEAAERCLNEIGITFLFAPLYHPAMKNVAPVRKELGIRTIFNLLGPLVNPANANVQVIGVARAEFVGRISKVLAQLSKNRKVSTFCAVIHESGYDELVLQGRANIAEVQATKIRAFSLFPKEFGLKKSLSANIAGGDVSTNVKILKEVLENRNHSLCDVVVANAALAIYLAEKMSGSASGKSRKELLLHAAAKARESLQSGKAWQKLNALIELSQKT